VSQVSLEGAGVKLKSVTAVEVNQVATRASARGLCGLLGYAAPQPARDHLL